MKRLHVNLAMEDLDQSIRFYAALFGAPPTVVKQDYAKWMLEDPRVNFAITARRRGRGLDHLGIQAESAEELDALASRFKQAGAATQDQTAAHCCYARSDKSWVSDPDGLRWKLFFTFGEAATYGEDDLWRGRRKSGRSTGACCAPETGDVAPSASSACCG